MQLRIQRSQRAGGLLGNTVFFCLDVRADYSPEEQSNVRKYKLGGEVIYNSQAARRHLDSAGAQLDRAQAGGIGERASGLARGALSLAMAKMRLNISIASLGRGHHIECKDLEELLEAEDTVRTACKGVTRFLEVAGTFNGSEVVIDYENGEERVHITQDAIPLLEYAPAASGSSSPSEVPSFAPHYEMGNDYKAISDFWRDRWLSFEQKIIELASSKGLTLTEQNVRVLSVVAGILLLVILFQIF
jgi:hypothetical protein